MAVVVKEKDTITIHDNYGKKTLTIPNERKVYIDCIITHYFYYDYVSFINRNLLFIFDSSYVRIWNIITNRISKIFYFGLGKLYFEIEKDGKKRVKIYKKGYVYSLFFYSLMSLFDVKTFLCKIEIRELCTGFCHFQSIQNLDVIKPINVSHMTMSYKSHRLS